MFLLKHFEIFLSTGWFTIAFVTLLTLIVLRFLLNGQRNLPPGPNGLPFLGYIWLFFGIPYEKLRELSTKYGDVVSFKLFGVNIVHLGSYDAIYEAFVTRGNDFSERPLIEVMRIAYPRTLGIVFSEDKSWKIHRRFLIRTLRDFGFGKLSIEQRIQDIANDLIRELEDSNESPMELRHFLTNAAGNVTFSIVFDRHFKTNDPVFIRIMANLKQMSQVPSSIFFLNGSMMKVIPIHYIPGVSSSLTTCKVFREIVDGFIEKHQRTFDPNSLRDYIDVYLNQMYKDNENGQDGESTFNLDRLNAIVTDMLIGGTETSANTINWALWYLMYNAEIQKKIHDEIDAIIGRERLPGSKDRVKMPYTEAVIQEVMRLSSVAPLGLFRTNTEELEFRSYTIPKNSVIIPNLWAVHYDSKEWPEPDKFDPSRFLNAKGEAVTRDHFCPFALGKRVCLGETLARTDIFILLTSILQRFIITPPDGAAIQPPLKINVGFVFRTIESYYLCAHKRY